LNVQYLVRLKINIDLAETIALYIMTFTWKRSENCNIDSTFYTLSLLIKSAVN
jgi:hypothetical protein